MTNERVRKIEWKPKWDGGAPMPQVFSNGQRVFLIYTIADWDYESIDKIEDLNEQNNGQEEFLALVEFDGHTFRFGVANDEVFAGLPYSNQGLEWGQIIESSKWIEEINQIHKVHPYFSDSNWTERKHYLLLFKDEMLEVIAKGYKLQIFKTTYNKLGQEIIRRINGILEMARPTTMWILPGAGRKNQFLILPAPRLIHKR